MGKQKVLETERLILRPYKISDAKEVRRLAGDIRIAETTLNIPHPYEDGMAEAWIKTHEPNFMEGKGVTYAITNKTNHVLLGTISLVAINNLHRKAELGYWIGFSYWNKGYCTEATKAIISLGFEDLNLNRIYALCLVDNQGSSKVMEKAGMKFEGIRRQDIIKEGIGYDLKSYGILRMDYK